MPTYHTHRLNKFVKKNTTLSCRICSFRCSRLRFLESSLYRRDSLSSLFLLSHTCKAYKQKHEVVKLGCCITMLPANAVAKIVRPMLYEARDSANHSTLCQQHKPWWSFERGDFLIVCDLNSKPTSNKSHTAHTAVLITQFRITVLMSTYALICCFIIIGTLKVCVVCQI